MVVTPTRAVARSEQIEVEGAISGQPSAPIGLAECQTPHGCPSCWDFGEICRGPQLRSRYRADRWRL